ADSAVLPLSAVLSGVAALAGVVCFLSFLDAACFALSGVVSWFCCATVNGIASTAKRRTVRILMRVSREKDQHYKGSSLLRLENLRPKIYYPAGLVTIPSQSPGVLCVVGNIQKEIPNMKTGLALMFAI